MIRKLRLLSKLMTSKPGKQTIAIHILPNTSRSKGNQTMIFGQLIEHIMRTIFLEKSYAKNVVGKPPRGAGRVQTFYSDVIYLPTFNSPICLTFISIID